MEWLLLLAVVIWIILFIRKKRSFKFSLPPKTLKIKPVKGLKKLSENLEQTLKRGYMENVEYRVRENNKLKENEYEWRFLDLKRYFIFTALLKESPMFSEKVDELWHQMLMFTREYEDFSKNYLRTTLHHSPNINIEPEPDLRGFFDWVYAELFFIKNENIHLYQGFFSYPVHPDVIGEFKRLPEDELIDIYFKSDSKCMPTVISLISSMKKTANRIQDYEKSKVREMMRKSKIQQNYNAMLVPFLSVS
ncbi:MAG: hypothetical protein RR642_14610, partial [Solibacillus sp.]